MSFSSQTKEVLCKTPYECPACRLAELAGFFACTGKISDGVMRVHTLNPALALRIISSLESELGITAQAEGSRIIIDEHSQKKLSDAISQDVMIYDCCKVSYIRGAFLGGGSVNAPDKKYHIEFSAKSDRDAQIISDTLSDLEFKPKITHRKEKSVVYIKEGEQIAELLGYISNGRVGLEFMSAQVEKEHKSSTQRQVNCESANLDKLARASSRHIIAIKQIKAAHKWSSMPEVLREIGELRLKHPDVSLEALGKMTEQGIGKSGVNHRLNRIVEYAQNLKT